MTRIVMKKKKVKKMSKKKQAAHDYKMQMQEEGDRMLAEIKAKKAKAALEEEEKLLQQELRQTVATEKKVRTKTLLEEGQQKLGAKEYGAAEEAKEPPAPPAEAASPSSEWEEFISSDTAGVFEALKQLEEMGFVAKNGFEKVLKAVQKHHAKDGIDLNAAIADLLQALKSA